MNVKSLLRACDMKTNLFKVGLDFGFCPPKSYGILSSKLFKTTSSL